MPCINYRKKLSSADLAIILLNHSISKMVCSTYTVLKYNLNIAVKYHCYNCFPLIYHVSFMCTMLILESIITFIITTI